MARSAKVNALRILAYTIAIYIFIMISYFISIGGNRYISPPGIEMLFALPIGAAGTTLGILYLIAKKEPISQRRLALGMLMVNLIVIICCPVVLIISEAGSFDSISLLARCFIAGIVGYLLSVLFMFSLVELIGKSRVGKISTIIGESRTERWRVSWSHAGEIWKDYSKSKLGMLALAIIVIITIMSIFGPYIVQEDPFKPKDLESVLPQPPSSQYWLGTDNKDMDIWSQMLIGGMPSLIVSLVSGAISIIMGTVIGLLAGYYGKWVDEILMRITDFFLVIPWFPLMIVLCAILGRGFIIIIIVIGILSWPDTARLIRAQVLAVKETKYIERARSIGAKDSWIMRRHILPQTFPLVIVCGVMIMAGAIFSESYLEFFGLGDPNICSWGMMLEKAEAGNAMVNLWWWWVAPPAIAVIALIMAFYIIGDTLDNILNPRLKKR